MLTMMHDARCTLGQLQPPPEYVDQRIRLFERLRTEYDEFVKGVFASSLLPWPSYGSVLTLRGSLAQPREPITITLPDGSERKGTSWETSPLGVAKEVSKSLSERVVIAKVSKPSKDKTESLLRCFSSPPSGRRRSLGSRTTARGFV